MNEELAMAAVMVELGRAQNKFPPFNSMHEGWAVIKEEVDELWETEPATASVRGGCPGGGDGDPVYVGLRIGQQEGRVMGCAPWCRRDTCRGCPAWRWWDSLLWAPVKVMGYKED